MTGAAGPQPEPLRARAVHYTETMPTEALAEVVRCYWVFRIDSARSRPYEHVVLPDGCVSLVHAAPPDAPARILQDGPRMKAYSVSAPPGMICLGVRLRPEAARVILGQQPERNQSMLLADVRPELDASLRDGLGGCRTAEEMAERCDAFLPGFFDAARPDAQVRRAVELIDAEPGRVRIDAVAEAVGLSPRQLLRRFRSEVGLTPKQYLRVRRLRTALANVLRATPDAWGRVAADVGYADQAHMAREFVALTGMSPTAFQERAAEIQHGYVRP